MDDLLSKFRPMVTCESKSTPWVTQPKPQKCLIQEDIGVHPCIPLRPPPLFLSVFAVSLIVAQFTIFGSFRVLNFWSRFEALNDVFLESNGQENMSLFRT